MSFKNQIRKIALKLGIKQYLLPVHEFINKRKAEKYMNTYDPSNTSFGLNTEKRDFDITVSFTTFPARIKYAVYVADAMLRQTLKPDRVVLVLASDEFASNESLPEDYKRLEERGLSIVFAENLKPHKKYLYTMRNYPGSVIITVDDDVLYPNDLIETLFHSYMKYPYAVSAMRAHRMLFNGKALLPYNDWGFESAYTDMPVFDLISTGVGGVLYPPGCMKAKYDILFNETAIRDTCLNSDDIWLKMTELLCGIPLVLANRKSSDPLLIPDSQKTSLHFSNVDHNYNDKVIRDIMTHLGICDEELYKKVCGITEDDQIG